MIAIQDVLLSDDIVQKAFICDLKACKGACCWKGDYGAPLSSKEQAEIESLLPTVSNYLPTGSLSIIGKEGPFKSYGDVSFVGTTLHHNGACAFMTTDINGIAGCSFQEAYHDQAITFQKPLSCHLYPIRVTINHEAGFEAWNYDKWDICTAACKLGQKKQVYVYEFLREPIIRAKGLLFYQELDAAAKYMNNQAL